MEFNQWRWSREYKTARKNCFTTTCETSWLSFSYVWSLIDENLIENFLIASITIAQDGFDNNEDLPSVNAFGVDLNLDSEPKHK